MQTASHIADALSQVAQGEAGPSTAMHGLVLPMRSGEGSMPPPAAGAKGPAGEEEGEGDDEALPEMAEDDYSAQLTLESQTKDNLKYVLISFSSLVA
jgi:hypothetical protein